MLDGAPTPRRTDTRWFDGTVSADATLTGILTPVAAHGRSVRKGDVIGTIRDYRGSELEQVRSPVDGYALYGLAGPPVKAGESVATIALPARGPL
jgi:predicted deacylase